MKKAISDQGFSLLELLVSLAILGMITVAIVTTLGTGRRVWEKSDTLDQTLDFALTRERLRTLIEAIPMPRTDGESARLFSGHAFGFSFLSLPGDGSFFAGIPIKVTVDITPGENVRLLRFAESGRLDISGSLETRVRILDDHAVSVKISYFGNLTPEGPPEWYAEWYSIQGLPELVKIEWERAGGVSFPPLTVRPGLIERQRFVSASSLVPPG